MSESETSNLSRIDWQAAFNSFVGLGPTRTFVRVAEIFGVSDTAVRLHANEHDWRRRAAKIDNEAQRRVEKRLVRERAARLADTLTLIDKARGEVLAKLEAGEAEVKIADLPALIKLEFLIEGEATDRVELREVRELVSRLFVITAPFIPVDRRREYLRALEEEAAAARPELEDGGVDEQ